MEKETRGGKVIFSTWGLVLGIAFTVLGAAGLVTFLVFLAGGKDADGITRSSHQRQPLSSSAASPGFGYLDEADLIGDDEPLLAGMQIFTEKTGVPPFVYFTDNIAGSTQPGPDEVNAFADSMYNELFTDEAHFLLIYFQEEGGYSTWYRAGEEAKSVMDSEAVNILLDCLNTQAGKDVSFDMHLGKAFSDAAGRIMTVQPPILWPLWFGLGFLALAAMAFIWWRTGRHRALAGREEEAVLETPLDFFSGSEVDEIEKEYEAEARVCDEQDVTPKSR